MVETLFWIGYALLSVYIGGYIATMFVREEVKRNDNFMNTPGAPLAVGCVILFIGIGWPILFATYGIGMIVVKIAGRLRNGNS